jgi:hypothetical protein
MDLEEKSSLVTVVTRTHCYEGHLLLEKGAAFSGNGNGGLRLLDCLNNPRTIWDPKHGQYDAIPLYDCELIPLHAAGAPRQKVKLVLIQRQQILYAHETDSRQLSQPQSYEARRITSRERVILWTDFDKIIEGNVAGSILKISQNPKTQFIALTGVILREITNPAVASGTPFLALNIVTIESYTRLN